MTETFEGNGRSIAAAGSEMRSYYGQPIIKEPTWTWEIPTYFFTGGVAGASAVLSTAAKLTGNERLSRAALYIGATADLVSPALLISDLGRPERFHHMLRVVKVTSPMNIGSWVLLVSGGASTTAAVLQRLDRLRPVRVAASIVSTLAGPLLATYTGVLVADTAVPVWHEGRHELPWIFGASAAASAGAAASMFVPPRDAGPARRLAVAGILAEGVLMQAMEMRLGTVGEVYRQGAAGKFSRAAKGLALAGATLLATRGRKSRTAAVAGGALACAGELCLRWAVFKAGSQSARDPKYVVESQRERVEQDGTKATKKP
ncbi:MAG TPA: NrfD/PsrC family molybdoenzyme membrane anchor subunit [Gaiellaceae bacterium]